MGKKKIPKTFTTINREEQKKVLPTRLKAIQEPTEEEINEYKNFIEKRKLPKITNEQRIMICVLHAKTFKRPYYEPCVNCSPAPYKKMIEDLDEVFNYY